MAEFIYSIPFHWVLFLGIVIALLAFDLGIFFKQDRELSIQESLLLTMMYVTVGLAFGFVIIWLYNPNEQEMCAPKCHIRSAYDYWNAFVIEKVLSMDNIFVMSVIFGYLKIPRLYQHRVLFWGILGVIMMRGLMIGIGTKLVSEFSWLLYIFGLFLIFTGFKMIFRHDDGDDDHDIGDSKLMKLMNKCLPLTNQLDGNHFFSRKVTADNKSKLFFTPLMTALIFIEIVDVIFAVDSVPAVFSITLDPFVVYTSNIFAILGLRALYSALDAVLGKFKYLEPALAVVLMFIGSKIFITDLLGLDKFPMELSLGITIGLIFSGVVYSVYRSAKEDQQSKQ